MAKSTFIAAVMSTALVMGLPATTAHASETAAGVDTITVVAPRVTHERQRGGVSTVIVTQRDAFVRVSDLDLTHPHDVAVLEERVDEAARRLCSELAQQSPFAEPNTPVCIRRAITAARSQLLQAM
jgi:UrcA family protein